MWTEWMFNLGFTPGMVWITTSLQLHPAALLGKLRGRKPGLVPWPGDSTRNAMVHRLCSLCSSYLHLLGLRLQVGFFAAAAFQLYFLQLCRIGAAVCQRLIISYNRLQDQLKPKPTHFDNLLASPFHIWRVWGLPSLASINSHHEQIHAPWRPLDHCYPDCDVVGTCSNRQQWRRLVDFFCNWRHVLSRCQDHGGGGSQCHGWSGCGSHPGLFKQRWQTRYFQLKPSHSAWWRLADCWC